MPKGVYKRHKTCLICKLFSRVKIKNGCWEYPTTNLGGYAVATFGSKQRLLGRFFFQVFNKKDPGKLLVCHKCDNRKCINPDHLFLGTHKDNVQDMIKKGRANYRSALTDKQKKMAFDLYQNKKMSLEEIAKKLSVSVTAVHGPLKKMNFSPRNRPLSKQDILKIIKLKKTMTYKEIALKFFPERHDVFLCKKVKDFERDNHG